MRSVLAAAAFVAGAAHAAPVTMAEAQQVSDHSIAAWTSGDAARMNALYAPGIVGFDPMYAPLVTDDAKWAQLTGQFAAMGALTATQMMRTVQILGSDLFVVSASWTLTGGKMPGLFTMRCTDVYRRMPTKGWLIVTEHCSTPPPPMKM